MLTDGFADKLVIIYQFTDIFVSHICLIYAQIQLRFHIWGSNPVSLLTTAVELSPKRIVNRNAIVLTFVNKFAYDVAFRFHSVFSEEVDAPFQEAVLALFVSAVVVAAVLYKRTTTTTIRRLVVRVPERVRISERTSMRLSECVCWCVFAIRRATLRRQLRTNDIFLLSEQHKHVRTHVNTHTHTRTRTQT